MLPQKPLPRYESSINGLEGVLSYTPFSVADLRNLRAAVTFKDPKAFVTTVVDIVERHTNLRALADAMPLHYIEAAFLKVYSKSVGGVLDAKYKCTAMVDANPPALQEMAETAGIEVEKVPCGFEADIKIPIDDVEVDYGSLPPGDHVVKLSNDSHVVLRTPGWDAVKGFAGKDGHSIAVSDEFVLTCIAAVGDGDTTYTREDFTPEELKEWVDALPAEDDTAFDAFFTSLPVVAKKVNVKCPKCGSEKTFELRGLDDFFV